MRVVFKPASEDILYQRGVDIIKEPDHFDALVAAWQPMIETLVKGLVDEVGESVLQQVAKLLEEGGRRYYENHSAVVIDPDSVPMAVSSSSKK